jgi:hypothetical protein
VRHSELKVPPLGSTDSETDFSLGVRTIDNRNMTDTKDNFMDEAPPLMVRVTAPATLPAGYTFEANLNDDPNRPFICHVVRFVFSHSRQTHSNFCNTNDCAIFSSNSLKAA